MSSLVTNNGGSFSGAGAENFNGTPNANATISATYSINSDCTFTRTATDNLGNTLHISGSIFGNGAEMAGISTDAGTAVEWTSYRLKKTQCTEASAKGTFAEEVQSPLTPAGPAIETAQLTVSSKGAKSGSFVINFNAGTIESYTFTGTDSMNSNCTFTSISSSSLGTTHWFGVGCISQNGIAPLMIDVESGFVGLATRY